MKPVFLLSLLFLVSDLFAQTIDGCGLDNDPIITATEAEFLEDYFKKSNTSFQFDGKKIAFVTGSSGSKIGSKSDYFSNIKKWQENGEMIATSIVVLTPDEKMSSGGYDVIITYWVKVFTPKSKNEIIEKLKSK